MTTYGKTFTCSVCGIAQAVEPERYSHRVIRTDRGDQNYREYVEAAYDIFVPPDSKKGPGYAVVVCSNCRQRVVVEISGYESPRAVWPLPGTAVSEDVPKPVRLAFADAIRAYAADSKTGAIMSLRTAIVRLQREQDVSNINDLWNKLGLPPSLIGAAHEPRLWGNVIGHDDFDSEAVTSAHVTELITFVCQVLEWVYVMPKKLERARQERKRIEGSEGSAV